MFIVAGCQLQVAKTYQFFKTFQVGKIDICRQPDLPV